MKVEMCDNFFYRITDEKEDVFSSLNTCKENVLRNNKNLSFYCGEWIKVKVNNYKTHIVKPAQTLQDISEIYGMEIDKIKSDNNLNTNSLFIGQILKIYN